VNCKEANALGLKMYFTGKPCKYGHIDKRLVVNGTCYACVKLRVANWQAKNPEKVTENQKRWQAKNPGLASQRRRDWYANNTDHAAKVSTKYRQANLSLINYLSSKARADKLQRTPKWLTQAHKKHIKSHYELAKNCAKELGGEWHVDHVVPLRGDNVSGLHVPWNLQVLPKIDNLKKGNSHAS
jgi:hypothetical protein